MIRQGAWILIQELKDCIGQEDSRLLDLNDKVSRQMTFDEKEIELVEKWGDWIRDMMVAKYWDGLLDCHSCQTEMIPVCTNQGGDYLIRPRATAYGRPVIGCP